MIKKIRTIAAAKKIKEGLFDMPDDIYFHPDCPGITRSQLNDFNISPQNYLYNRMNSRKETPAMKLGTAFHCAVFEPDVFKNVYRIMPEFKGVKGNTISQQTEFWHITNPDKIGISKKEKILLDDLQWHIFRHHEGRKLINYGHPEITAFAKDPETGLLLKCKIDYLKIEGEKSLLTDVKTSKKYGALSYKFLRDVSDDEKRYYVQAAFYSHIMSLLGYDPTFKFLVIEKEPPYHIGIFKLDEGFLELGFRHFMQNLVDFKNSIDFDSWPGYTQEMQLLYAPNYLIYRELN